jgi:hypothetical protein
MSEKYVSAILHWRRYAGAADTWPRATVATMLFACRRWSELHGADADGDTSQKVLAIKEELEAWIAHRNNAAYASLKPG